MTRHPLDDEFVRFCLSIAVLPYVLALSLGALAYDIINALSKELEAVISKRLQGD